jgi:restriction system protein
MPLSEVRARVSVSEGLTPEDMQELLSSGQPVFTNRISWAVVYVAGAGLVEKVRRGVYRLTAGGERLLAQAPARIDKNVLRNYPAYVEWSARKSVRSPNRDTAPAPPDDSADTPEEALERAARQLHGALEGDVLDRVREAAPEFLERLVVDLLIALGYGGGDAEMGRVTGRSGDGGIDGTIREDALGLDEVCLQTKKFAAGQTVGANDLRNFAGAIDTAGTTKGVFVTTAGFTRAAKDYVALSPKRIVLIDGEELARLMVTHNIGVRRKIQYDVKRIDEDYFDLEGL